MIEWAMRQLFLLPVTCFWGVLGWRPVQVPGTAMQWGEKPMHSCLLIWTALSLFLFAPIVSYRLVCGMAALVRNLSQISLRKFHQVSPSRFHSPIHIHFLFFFKHCPQNKVEQIRLFSGLDTRLPVGYPLTSLSVCQMFWFLKSMGHKSPCIYAANEPTGKHLM